MVFPGYQLNPGDLFQVDVERVMTSTGRPRPSQAKKYVAHKKRVKVSQDGEDAVTAEAETVEENIESEEAEPLDEEAIRAAKVNALRQIRERAKDVIKSHKSDMPGNRKKALRALMKEARANMSRGQRASTPVQDTQDIVDRLTRTLAELQVGHGQRKDAEKEQSSTAELEVTLTKRDLALIKQQVKLELENPYDPSKPYLTPWLPRPYMSPFAFIPRYLEVNQKICAAVYLRHPVARKGAAEVPTPFPENISQMAFNWYLRRG